MKLKFFLLGLLPAMTLLLLAASGTLYKGKFVDGGYSPAFIGDAGGLSNLSGNLFGYGLNIGYSNQAFAPITAGSNIFIFGFSNQVGSVTTGSSNIFIYGSGNLNDARITNSSDIYVTGKDIATNAVITGSSLILLQLVGGADRIVLSNSSRIIVQGNDSGSNAFIANTLRLSADGGLSLYDADVRDSSDIRIEGNQAAYNTTIRNSTNLFFAGIASFYNSTISNVNYLYGIGPGALAGVVLTNSRDVVAIGFGAGVQNNGSYTQLFLLGTGAAGTNSYMMDFGTGYTNGYRFRGPGPVVATLATPTNGWAGPTNTLYLNTNDVNFVASGDCAITNVGGQKAGLNTWSTLIVSNSTASAITVRTYAPGARLQGSTTTAALSIGAGKEGFLTFHCRDFKSTNFVTSAQQ